MHIQLSDHFTFGKLIRFTLPSIAMMIFTSVYSVVDGLFVSNFVGKTPFAALNLIWPLIGVLSALGFMMGTGGSAMVAKTLGEGDRPRANRYFSLFVYVTLALGVLAGGLGIVFTRPIAVLLGADEALLGHCVVYGRILLAVMPFFMLQVAFQSFFIAAEKPGLGFAMTVGAGLVNILLDALFVAVLGWGLPGAAAATAISQTVGGVVPLFYFARPNTSLLRLGRTRVERRPLWLACMNGSSELMSNLSGSLVSMLYNARLMAIAGQNGVAAYGVIMYINFVFIALFLGYSIGIAPVVSFHYGARNRPELKNLLRKSLVILVVTSAGITALSLLSAVPLSRVFVGYDPDLLALTVRAFRLYALSFLVVGFNLFGSGFFTALNNGPVSAAISFLRTFVFQIAAVLALPLLLDTDGIWLAVPLSELLCLGVTAAFLVGLRKKYGYA